ncbi:MAG: lipid A export permease/ATP-binding protein MsbA [Coxiellaceae bacterium]|nr:lipid A export permease/ATP-binding protein MsbA [Coxiellaceae bacterium]
MSKLIDGLQTYKRLLKFVQKYWAIFVLGIIGTTLLSLIDAGFTWLVKPIINRGFINRDVVFFFFFPLIIVFIFLLRGVAGFVSNYFINRVARNVVMDFRRLLFDKLLQLPAPFYDHNSSGHLLSTIIYNVEQVAQASSDALLTCLRESSLAVGLITVMFVVNWKLSLLFLVITPLIAWVLKWSSSRLRRLSTNVQQSVGDVTHVADEGIQGYRVIRLFGGQEYERTKFYWATKRNQQRELKVVITNSVGTALVQMLIAIPIAITLLFATMPSLHISAGSFAAIVAAMISLLRPVRRMTLVNAEIQKGVAGAASIFTILDEPVENDHGTKALLRAKGLIEYRQVNFQYPSSKGPILKDISFTVQPGHTVAIVGRSGSGKSTLINLLPRFYEIVSGALTIDGIDVREYKLSDLRQQFALVSQNTMLFDDTIAKNIAYGLGEEVSHERIEAAAAAAHAMEFIRQLPDGLDTLIGQDGVLLSGGQRQRIAIARALLKNAPILILDEATSSLDTQSERHIQAALEGLMDQCTTLVIAHRLSTIENADWIMVMEEGVIVQQGTHKSLIAEDGVYATLHGMQFKEEGEVTAPA